MKKLISFILAVVMIVVAVPITAGAAHTHSIVKVPAKAPTCTEAGWNAYEYCTGCDYTTYEEIPENYNLICAESKISITTEGDFNKYECTLCDYSVTESLPILGSDVAVFYLLAHETKEGDTTLTVDLIANIPEESNISAAGWILDIPSNLTLKSCERGWYDGFYLTSQYISDNPYFITYVSDYYTDFHMPKGESAICTFIFDVPAGVVSGQAFDLKLDFDSDNQPCDEEMNNLVESGDAVIYDNTIIYKYHTHSLVQVEAKTPICTELGYNAYEYCDACDYTTYEVIPATGHTPGEWVIVTEVTETVDGIYIQKCTVCGEEIERREIPAGEKLTSNDVEIVIPEGVIDPSAQLVVNEVDVGNILMSLPENSEAVGVYDIYFEKDSDRIQPDGTVTVRIPVPTDVDGTSCKIYYVDELGNVTDMNALYEGGYMVFATDHFSYYTLVEENTSTPGDVNRDGNVNVANATALLKHIAKWNIEIDTVAADVNDDGNANVADVTLILKYIAKWDVELK